MICNKCGKEILDGSQFCEFCGNQIVVGEDRITKKIESKITKNPYFIVCILLVVFGLLCFAVSQTPLTIMLSVALIAIGVFGIIYVLVKFTSDCVKK